MLISFLKRTAVPPALLDTGSWQLVDADDPADLPDSWRGVPGPWRQDGTPMHGLYARPAADAGLLDQLDGMAVLHGWRAGFWRGPAALAGWSSPLVSYWNPLLAQGDGRFSIASRVDHDVWTAAAVISGIKPYGYLSCSRRFAAEVRARAVDAPFGIAVSDYSNGGIDLARTATLAQLFPQLPQLLTAYAGALPFVSYARDVRPLGEAAATVSPADFLGQAGFLALESGPLAVLGLVLGYPPLVTAGWLQRPAGMWVERGSLPEPTWQPAPCLTTPNGDAR
jgi:hypothetical protein